MNAPRRAAPFDRVEVRGVSKFFGATTALRGVSFTAKAGAITVLEGENGSGKSTLLSILAGLAKPSRGEVRIGDRRASETAALLRRHVGVVSHAPLLYPDLTGRENLAFFAGLYGVADAEARIGALGEALGLAAFWDRPVRTYSRGQSQRVSIARALVHEPQILLFDEPATGLDSQSGKALEDAMLRARDEGRVVILVTHDPAAAARLGATRLVLVRGQLAGAAAAEAVP